MSAPTVQPLRSTLPRVFDGDIVVGDSSAWLVLGDTPGAQSRQAVPIPQTFGEPVYRVPDSDLEVLPVVIGSRQPVVLTLEKAIQQVKGLTGHDWPAPTQCDDPRLNEFAGKISELRDALTKKTDEMIKMLALQDPANQLAIMKKWVEEKAAKDKEVMTALSAASAVASAIPVIGAVLSALISIVAALGGGAAVGPVPQTTPMRELFERDSYRGFSALLFNAERGVQGDTWDQVDDNIARRYTQFVDMVDHTLDVLTKALRLPFKCMFPAWWEPGVAPASVQHLREFRMRAARFPTDWDRFRGGAALDLTKPRFMLEYLPDPNSEAINSLLTGSAKDLPAGPYITAAMKKPAT